MKAWTVTIPVAGGEAEIDTVFQDAGDAEDVRRSLIDHDGYSERIIVRAADRSEWSMLDWNGRKGAKYRGGIGQ